MKFLAGEIIVGDAFSVLQTLKSPQDDKKTPQ